MREFGDVIGQSWPGLLTRMCSDRVNLQILVRQRLTSLVYDEVTHSDKYLCVMVPANKTCTKHKQRKITDKYSSKNAKLYLLSAVAMAHNFLRDGFKYKMGYKK